MYVHKLNSSVLPSLFDNRRHEYLGRLPHTSRYFLFYINVTFFFAARLGAIQTIVHSYSRDYTK